LTVEQILSTEMLAIWLVTLASVLIVNRFHIPVTLSCPNFEKEISQFKMYHKCIHFEPDH
jgi:hypothetical protein